MKQIYRFLLAVVIVLCAGISAKAVGWPANYQGVMLQGFYWDSYNDTKWATLEANADEYAKYFSLIWVPNSAKAEGMPTMGYHPVYWFTNHNSSFGSEAQLRSMIKAYQDRGTGIIADVIINHRSGVSNWTNFPTEQWNGKTYKIGPEGICRNDEVAGQSGQATPTGANDTGEGWNGSRDLDHTNANVQANCKDYVKCLLTDYGYAGVRYDFVKGYGPQYTKMYNQANNVKFSVGEYMDGNYDLVKNWIEGTGRESAAFDFPFKFQVNKAFADNNMAELVWKANGTTDQPCGMIHFGYAQFAVTFLDNHDTYREDYNKFKGDIVAGNAFMLFSPGTPCVFLPHYKQYKAQIQKLIDIRNACGIHNCSKVTVLKATQNCYMAEIEGTKGKAVVRIGDAQDTPSGYSSSDIKASGNKYCVWSKTGGVNPDPNPNPNPNPTPGDDLYLMGYVSGHDFTDTTFGLKQTSVSGNVYTWKDALIGDAGAGLGYINIASVLGQLGTSEDWDMYINNGVRYGAPSKDTPLAPGTPASVKAYMPDVDASACESWAITPGTYTVTLNLNSMTISLDGDNPDPNPNPNPNPTPDPEGVTIYWDNSTANWATPYIHYWGGAESTWPGVAMTKVEGNIWKYVCPEGTTGCLFNAGDGDATKTSDFVAVNNHVYNQSGDQGVYNGNNPNPNPNPNPDPTPGDVTLYWDNSTAKWATPYIHYWGASESTWPGVAMTKVEGNIWKYVCPEGTTGCLFNAGDGDATKTSDFVAVNNHVYNQSGDQGVYNGGDNPGPNPNPNPGTPDKLYVMGNLEQGSWATNVGVAMTKSGNKFTASGVTFVAPTDATSAYFSLVTVLGTTGTDDEWDGVINGSDRYGATAPDAPVTAGTPAAMQLFAAGVNASSAYAWAVAPGTYTITADFDAMTVTLTTGTNPNPDPDPTPGEDIYMIGYVEGHDFSDTTYGLKQTSAAGKVYTWKSALIGDAGAGLGYINFATVLGQLGTPDDWDTYINNGVRYGAPAQDTPLAIGTPASVKAYIPDVDASACQSWAITPGTYDVTLDLGTMKISLSAASGIEDVTVDADAPAVYYNLRGMRVEAPESGLYIEVRGGKARKVAF